MLVGNWGDGESGDVAGFGLAIASVGDWDRDGGDDLAILFCRGSMLAVRVCSGRTWDSLAEWQSEIELTRARCRLELADDLDGDGRGELAVQAEHRLLLVDLVAGRVLFEYPGISKFTVGPDGDGDGKRDLVLTVAGSTVPLTPSTARLVSSASGRVLWETSDVEVDGQLGATIVACPDLDGDGTPELAFGAPSFDGYDTHGGEMQDRGMIRIASGADGRTLLDIAGAEAFDRLGDCLCWTGAEDPEREGLIARHWNEAIRSRTPTGVSLSKSAAGASLPDASRRRR